MKLLKFSSLLILGFSILISCKKEEVVPKPTPDFAYTGGGCTAPCAVLFENKSKDAASCSWNFGDGTSSTEVSPTKTYNVGGTYTVTLTASGLGGTESTSKQILIQQSTASQLPVPNFTFSGGGCMAPCNISFTNTSTNAISYAWDFGDGSTSTSNNPNHTYTSGGAYSVILRATNAAGTSQITKNVNIANAPTRVRITNITIINFPFVDPNGSSWDIGNGPDLFFKITDMDNTVLLDGSGSRIDDVVSSMLPVSWSLTTPFEITDFNSLRYVDAWDYDTFDPDDLIGYVSFVMNDYTSGSNPYPTTVTKTENGVTIRLNLTWQ